MRTFIMYDEPKQPDVPDYYAILGVSSDATSATIKKSFRLLALKHHPDKKVPGETVDAVEFREVSSTHRFLIVGEAD
jgi:DnaJ-class molecular chaperone